MGKIKAVTSLIQGVAKYTKTGCHKYNKSVNFNTFLTTASPTSTTKADVASKEIEANES